MIRSFVLFSYQLAMYLAHLFDAHSWEDERWWASSHPMYLCNWLPRAAWARRRRSRRATYTQSLVDREFNGR